MYHCTDWKHFLAAYLLMICSNVFCFVNRIHCYSLFCSKNILWNIWFSSKGWKFSIFYVVFFKYVLHDSIQCFRVYSIFFILVLLLSTSFFLKIWLICKTSIIFWIFLHNFTYMMAEKWRYFFTLEKKELFCKGLVGKRSGFYTVMQWQKK